MDNPNAFPEVPADSNAYEGRPGMSLRDWFAGQALIGLMSHSVHDHCPLFGGGQPFARDAYIVADAMLAERAKSSDLDPIDTSVGGVDHG